MLEDQYGNRNEDRAEEIIAKKNTCEFNRLFKKEIAHNCYQPKSLFTGKRQRFSSLYLVVGFFQKKYQSSLLFCFVSLERSITYPNFDMVCIKNAVGLVIDSLKRKCEAA